MNRQNISLDFESKKPVIRPVKKNAAADGERHDRTVCPDCGIKLIRLGHCFTCPLCGYGGCS